MNKTNGRKAAQAKKPAPLTITLQGRAAQSVRIASRSLGMRPSTAASIFVTQGELLSGNSEEAREFRLAIAADYVGLSQSATTELHAHAKRATAEYVANLRTRLAKKGGAAR